MHSNTQNYALIDDATETLVNWAKNTRATADNTFEAARQICTRLGAHYHDGITEIGFWAPQIARQNIPAENVFLEILTPQDELDLTAEQQTVTFQRERLNLVQDDVYFWGVASGMKAGTRDELGTFYWLKYTDHEGNWHYIIDYLAYSVPYGVFAPAELYDYARMQRERGDLEYLANLDVTPDPDGVMRVQQPTNILQIHPGTASEDSTLAGLNRVYQTIAAKIERGDTLTPAEQNYIAYDAVQLMPIEPPIEHEAGPVFWDEDDDQESDTVEVSLHRHNIINWGYDVMVAASSAPNPSILGTNRPNELMDLIVTLHNFPGKPIKVIFDIVYGHTDNQAISLLPEDFLAGSNMYGQNLNYLHPVTRAIMLEMQRRKHGYGVDGIRVDGAQDFKWWNQETDTMVHDDDYLRLMNDLVLEVNGVEYRPWMIFEDGRPWPAEDWELTSTYREVTKQMPNVWQWGPLTFAHNTPFLFTFWVNKWWRIREIAEVGRNWITGCANHDTLRRGTQVPTDARINKYLGNTLPEIIRNAYDNTAAKMFDYAMMPGIPMDFINASMRTPWGFIRNTDNTYGVKVVSEEARFSRWLMTEERYQLDTLFLNLKSMGFHDLNGLRDFMFVLDHAVQATNYDLEAIARIMNSRWTPDMVVEQISVKTLKDIALAWMEDIHEFCNVSHFVDEVDAQKSNYNRQLREFRRQRPWLMENLTEREHLGYLHPTDGNVVFYGLRVAPDDSEQILFIANMEGAPRTLIPAKLPIPHLEQDGWQVAIKAPDMEVIVFDQPITLYDSQAVTFIR